MVVVVVMVAMVAMVFFIHSCSDGVTIKETQSPALVGGRPRGGGNGPRAHRLADPSEVALTVRASCEATSSFGELRGSNAQHGNPLTSRSQQR